MGKNMGKNLVKAERAIDKILENLATSDFADFADRCGKKALDELKEYRADMAADIAAEFDKVN